MTWLADVVQRRAGVMGINRRNLELVRRRNPRRLFPLANNKVLAKSYLLANGIPVAESLGIYEAFYQLKGLPADMKDHQAFVLKPANGRGGQGILVIAGRDGDAFVSAGGKRYSADRLRRHAAAILFGAFSLGIDDRVLVEERLVAHAGLAGLSPDGLPDIRLMLIDGELVMAMLRAATRASDGKANLHQGGIGLGVDIDSGTTTTAFWRGKPIDRHPDTGEPLAGVQIPHWVQARRIASHLGLICGLRFLGVDVTVDRKVGPVVLEFNARPGLEIQNANQRGLRCAIASSNGFSP